MMRGGRRPPAAVLARQRRFLRMAAVHDGARAALRRDRARPPGLRTLRVPPWLDAIGDLAHFYRAFIEALGLHGVALAGHGIGGWIAARARAARRARTPLAGPGRRGRAAARRGRRRPVHVQSPAALHRASYADVRRAPATDDVFRAHVAKNALMTARVGVAAAVLRPAAREVAAPLALAHAGRLGRGRRDLPGAPSRRVCGCDPGRASADRARRRSLAARSNSRRHLLPAPLPSSTEYAREIHRVPPHAVRRPRSDVHRPLRVGVGDAAQQLLRSGQRARALQPLSRRARVRRPGGFRWDRHQRTPSERVRPDADARRDRRARSRGARAARSRCSDGRCRW